MAYDIYTLIYGIRFNEELMIKLITYVLDHERTDICPNLERFIDEDERNDITNEKIADSIIDNDMADEFFLEIQSDCDGDGFTMGHELWNTDYNITQKIDERMNTIPTFPDLSDHEKNLVSNKVNAFKMQFHENLQRQFPEIGYYWSATHS